MDERLITGRQITISADSINFDSPSISGLPISPPSITVINTQFSTSFDGPILFQLLPVALILNRVTYSDEGLGSALQQVTMTVPSITGFSNNVLESEIATVTPIPADYRPSQDTLIHLNNSGNIGGVQTRRSCNGIVGANGIITIFPSFNQTDYWNNPATLGATVFVGRETVTYTI